MKVHRWSGWPGAYCLDCGVEDQLEIAIAEGRYDPYTDKWEAESEKEEYQKTIECKIRRGSDDRM